MKDRFFGWYPREPEFLAGVWDRAIFVPDANVLLHCLRHPAKIRDELLRLFSALKESLWIPYQVGHEFHRNRLDVELGAQDTYQRLKSDYDGILNQAKEKLKQLRAHPMINVERELAAIEMFLEDFRGRMEAAATQHPSAEIQSAVDQLTMLFDGRVGDKWTQEQLNTVKKEGEERYSKKLPPGFKDIKKDGDIDKYGDLIVWKDMIAKAEKEKRPIVFISDDVKEDWWWLHRGRKLGPRPELVEEFRLATGQDFLIYEFANFLRVAAERYQEIKESVDEVEKSLLEDERAKRRKSEADELSRDLFIRISQLEDEREEIIQLLSGSPSVEMDRSKMDRASLRERLSALNEELDRINNYGASDASMQAEENLESSDNDS